MAALTYLLLMNLSQPLRIVASWDVGAGTYLLLAWLTIAGADSDATHVSTQTLRQSGIDVGGIDGCANKRGKSRFIV